METLRFAIRESDNELIVLINEFYQCSFKEFIKKPVAINYLKPFCQRLRDVTKCKNCSLKTGLCKGNFSGLEKHLKDFFASKPAEQFSFPDLPAAIILNEEDNLVLLSDDFAKYEKAVPLEEVKKVKPS